jgi:uncharacterized protein (DUF1810 family)
METVFNLNRFLEAQETKYNDALSEIKNGRKLTHWMWYIFPQIAGLGFTDFNVLYAIQNKEEATQYLNHPVLRKRLIEISKAVVEIEGKTALEIFGKPDERKLKSSMTLFSIINHPNPIFQHVLDKYYKGMKDENTLKLIK